MDDNQIIELVNDVKEEMVREMEQGVMKHDLYQSTAALGGKDACDRILLRLTLRAQARLRVEPRRREKA